MSGPDESTGGLTVDKKKSASRSITVSTQEQETRHAEDAAPVLRPADFMSSEKPPADTPALTVQRTRTGIKKEKEKFQAAPGVSKSRARYEKLKIRTTQLEESKHHSRPDSTEMRELKEELEQLVSRMDVALPQFTEQNEGKATQVFAVQLNQMLQSYETVLQKCDAYLQHVGGRGRFTGTGRERKRLVRKIRQGYEIEKNAIAGMAWQMHDKLGADATWKDILYCVRADKLNDEDFEVSSEGAGTSVLHKRKEKKTKALTFLKEEEKMWQFDKMGKSVDSYVKLFRRCAENTTDGDKVFKALKAACCNKAGKLNRTLYNNVQILITGFDRGSGIFEEFDRLPEPADGNYQKLFNSLKTEWQIPDFQTGIMQTYKVNNSERAAIMAIVRCVSKDKEAARRLFEIRRLRNKKATEFIMGHRVAGIESGSEISNRNATSSLAAKCFGAEGLIAESVPVMLKTKDGTYKKANSMEGIGGLEMSKLRALSKETQKPIHYSPKAQMQLNTLQMLDVICGQVDRHRGNYKVEYTEKTVGDRQVLMVESITGIDNDLAFGNLTYEDCRRQRKGCMLTADRSSIHYLPERFVNRLRLYAENPAMLQMTFCHLRTQKEINAMSDRLRGVLADIERRIVAQSLKLVDENNEQQMEEALNFTLDNATAERTRTVLTAGDNLYYTDWPQLYQQRVSRDAQRAR